MFIHKNHKILSSTQPILEGKPSPNSEAYTLLNHFGHWQLCTWSKLIMVAIVGMIFHFAINFIILSQSELCIFSELN